MAKFLCVCGESISTSGGIPNANEWRCLSDIEFDRLFGQVDVEDLYRQMVIFYRCPVSDHIWAFWDGLDSPPSLYAPAAVLDEGACDAHEAGGDGLDS